MPDTPVDPPKVVIRSSEDDAARQLPKKFFKQAVAVPTVDGDGFGIELDSRALKTPRRERLQLPTRALGEAVAAEWNELEDVIDPALLPLTKLANTAIDGILCREREVHDDIVRYIGNDLLFYRAETPDALAKRQAASWDPILRWFEETYGAGFMVTAGIMPIEQDIRSVAKAASALSNETAMTLAPLHVMTTLTGSALLAIAHHHGALDIEAVWNAAHVDEDWQIEQWGEDAEAMARRQVRRGELEKAAEFLRLAA